MSIKGGTGNNIGGLAQLHYALQREVNDLFDFEYDSSFTLTVANLDSRFDRIRFVPRSANHDSDFGQESSGVRYRHMVQCSVPHANTTLRDYLQSVSDSQICLVMKDNNGQWWILPYCTPGASRRTGKEPINSNAYTLDFSAELGFEAIPLSIIP